MCVGNESRSICGLIGIPPQVAAIETSGKNLANDSKFLNICCPSSLVGASITA